MNSKYLIHVLILLLIGGNAFCKTIRVPEDKPNLRAAIKKAKSGDVVLVSPGIYRGPDNKNLVIKKTGITVRSVEGPFNTIIDGEGTGRCFDVRPMKLGKDRVYDRITITGFTIRNFSVDSTEGGAAVRCQSYIWLLNCIIANNNAGTGGGIFLSGRESSILLSGNTIVDNKGGGVHIDPTSIRPNEIGKSIFWENSPYDLYSAKKELIAVCNIKGGDTRRGCFEDDPLFADPENGNYRLTSCSPCIDASMSKNPRDGMRDVGVYSLPYAPCNPADSIRLYTTIDPRTGDTLNVLTDEDFEKVVSINREGHRSVSIIIRIPAGCVMSSRQLEGLLTSADNVLTPRELSTYANIGLIRLNVTILPAENSENYYLSDELLKTLAEDRYVNRDDRVIGKLKISDVNQLTGAQAKLLGEIKCNLLRLEHLSVMSDDIAEHLSKAKAWKLSLPGVSQLTNNQAVLFSNFESNLFFPGLQNISNEQAKAFANFKGKNLWLNGLHDINDEQARAFASYQGEQLYLGVNSLTVEQAEVFAEYCCGMIRFVDINPTWNMYNILVNNEYIQLSHRPLPSQLYSSQDTTNLIYTGTTKLKNAYGDYTSLQLRAFATDGYIRAVEVTVETSQRITGLALSPFIRYKLEESEPFIGFMISDELVEEDTDMKIPIEPNSKSKLLFHYFMGHTVHGNAKFPTVADLQAGRIEIEFQLGGQMFGLTEIP